MIPFIRPLMVFLVLLLIMVEMVLHKSGSVKKDPMWYKTYTLGAQAL